MPSARRRRKRAPPGCTWQPYIDHGPYPGQASPPDRAAHRLNAAYDAAGRRPPPYTDDAVIARVTAITAAHVVELRDAILGACARMAARTVPPSRTSDSRRSGAAQSMRVRHPTTDRLGLAGAAGGGSGSTIGTPAGNRGAAPATRRRRATGSEGASAPARSNDRNPPGQPPAVRQG